MLNYIWFALIVIGIGVALSTDIVDQSNNKFRNGGELPVEIADSNFLRNDLQNAEKLKLKVAATVFSDFYNEEVNNDYEFSVNAVFDSSKGYYAVYFLLKDDAPDIWEKIAKVSGNSDDITGILKKNKDNNGTIRVVLLLENASFIKMKDVTNAALDSAATSVNIALGLIGIMALWLGLMRIADEAGLIKIIARIVRPVTKFLFPAVPGDHPAIGSMVMNISANLLGLGNAATPFGLKAMEELDKLNEDKGTATDAMCMFLAINTAGFTLVPATAIAVRAAAGSSNPAIIIGTCLFGSFCATITGITAVKIFQMFSLKNSSLPSLIKGNLKRIAAFLFLLTLIIILTITGIFGSIFHNADAGIIKNILQVFSLLAIPVIILTFLGFAVFKKVKIYEVFVEGAKEGFNIAVRIIPYLVAMLVAIGIFRAGGGMDILTTVLSPFTNLVGFPAEVLPMAIMRPLSGSGSLGVMAEIISVHGADSFFGLLASTIMGSTETTFYVIALYFGSVNIKKTRYALAAGLMADAAGILAALVIVKLMLGLI